VSEPLARRERGPGAGAESREPIALIHGWGLNLAVWDTTIAALAVDRLCIAIDLPGHGHSRSGHRKLAQ